MTPAATAASSCRAQAGREASVMTVASRAGSFSFG